MFVLDCYWSFGLLFILVLCLTWCYGFSGFGHLPNVFCVVGMLGFVGWL